mmetsp:Transcript_1812/g.8112  ORF Transcript_1812/g.8112 Transcript_1812/m.8112 type:complete len:252 (+) Transcript_1812:398-1153(+)
MTWRPTMFTAVSPVSSSSPTSSTQGTSATHRTPAFLSSVRAYAAMATRSLFTIDSHRAVNAAVAPGCAVSSSGTISLAGLDICAHRPTAARGRKPSRCTPSCSHARFASDTSLGATIAFEDPYSTNLRVSCSRPTYAPSALAMCLVSACSSVRSFACTFTALGFLASAAGAKSATEMDSPSPEPNRRVVPRTRRRFRDFLRKARDKPSMRSAEHATSSWPCPVYNASSWPVLSACTAVPSSSSSSRVVKFS